MTIYEQKHIKNLEHTLVGGTVGLFPLEIVRCLVLKDKIMFHSPALKPKVSDLKMGF